MKARDKTKVSQTFHGAGLIVPYDKETQVRQFEVAMMAEIKIETYFTYVFPRFRQCYDRQLHTCTLSLHPKIACLSSGCNNRM